jgi:DNA-binding MarR family transcriptional regulator
MPDAAADPWSPAAGPPAMAELERLIGFHVSMANLAVKGHFQKHFFPGLGLTQKQIAVLWLVDGSPGIVQVDLAKLLGVKRASMSAMANILRARGLVEQQGQGSVDARHVPLQVTSRGRKMLEEAKRAIERHEAWVKQHYSPSEQRAVATLMRKLYQGAG